MPSLTAIEERIALAAAAADRAEAVLQQRGGDMPAVTHATLEAAVARAHADVALALIGYERMRLRKRGEAGG